QTAQAAGELVVEVPGEPMAAAYAPDVLGDDIRVVPVGGASDDRRAAGPSRARDDGVEQTSSAVCLPILAYHRVTAEPGPHATAALRITPDVFEQHLRHLRDAGYRSVSPSEWGAALARQTPIDARGIMVTFDDGYRDFREEAWPLLDRYGFTALVFLVSSY